MKEIIVLSRWKEHIPFTIPLTVLGAIIASSNGAVLDVRLIYIVLANVATVSYAFMINDIEDAEDDARDHIKAKRNPISAGRLSTDDAYTVLRLLAIAALIFYALVNKLTFGIGLSTLLLSHLYSWRKVRLKAYPVTDIVSHSLMLSGLLLFSGFSAFSSEFRHIWLLSATAVMFSVYGQLYNQIRDYEVDEKAGLRNTTLLVGKRRAQFLMNVSIIVSVVSLLTSIYFRIFPAWLMLPVFLGFPLAFSLKPKNDSSGVVAVNVSGKLQLQLLLVFNLIVLFWIGNILITSFYG